MKNLQLFTFSTIFGLALLFSSCATNHEVEKLLVGKWNPVTIENLTPPPPQPAATSTSTSDSSDSGKVGSERDLKFPNTVDSKEGKIARVMFDEMRSPVMISITNNQKTFEKYYPGKTVKGSWKLKKNGKRITVKENESGRKLTIDIVSLTDSIAVVFEKLPFGEFKVKYAKQK